MSVHKSSIFPLPPLSSLYFYLTSYCNLRCRHCWLAPLYTEEKRAPEEADVRLLQDIIEQALPLGLRRVKITGGEPFLNKAIFPLIRYASQRQISIDIETNATLIDKQAAIFLKKHRVKMLAVSLDSNESLAHEELRCKQGCFQQALEGLRFLANQGINTQVIMAIYKRNVEYLEETLNLAEACGAKSFKINPVIHVARGLNLEQEGLMLSVADCIKLQERVSQEIQPRHKIRIMLDIPPAFKQLKAVTEERCTCGIKNILGVLPDGSASICGIGSVVSSLRLGSLDKEPLAEIWQANPILEEIRSALPRRLQGVCGICIFKGFCLGKCRAEAYYSQNSLLAPFWFCQQAYENGLFPRHRLIDSSEHKIN